MQGSIRKKGKNYYIRYYEEIDGQKKQREKVVGPSYDEAEKKLNEVLYKMNTGYIDKNMLISTYLNMWLEDFVKDEMKESTYYTYKTVVNNYIIPKLGNIKLCDLKVIHIEKFLRDLRKSKLKDGTIHRYYTTLKASLNRAVKLQLLYDNPCRFVTSPKKGKSTTQILTVDEFNKIYTSLNKNTHQEKTMKLALSIALETGCRRGELCGLEWKDIDFSDNTITFNQSLTMYSDKWTITTLKTESSYRTIAISNELSEKLRKYKSAVNTNKIKYGTRYINNVFNGKNFDLIFVKENGRYIQPYWLYETFKKLIAKNEINKNIRWHDLRHTSATIMLENGISMKVIQKRLGHSSMDTTSNIYSHVTEKMDRDAISVFNLPI